MTKSDMRLISHKGVEIPEWNTFQNHFGSKNKFIKELKNYLLDSEKYANVLQMCSDYIAKNTLEIPTSNANEPISTLVLEFVYLLKSGKFYKIGRTNSVGRRQYEIATQMPEEVTEVHKISTDDSAGIERYWHQRFASKR